MYVLGIETSCDETGVAIYHEFKGLVAHRVFSQIEMQKRFGGVVPELASRDHVIRILPLIKEILIEAEITKHQLSAVAYTAGPGLIGALLTGAAFGKTLGFALNIPTIAIHHLEAHLLAPLLEANKPQFPFLALLVSGGHTMLVHVLELGHYRILGESLDDAAGEAFDKTARLLNLPYPGGPLLAKLAESGNPNAYNLPRPMLDRPGLDFSFSGLKTKAAQLINTHPVLSPELKADLAASVQEAIVDSLVLKCQRAIHQTQEKQLVIAGGVSANLRLRTKLQNMMNQEGGMLFYPRQEFCTDNGAMIAYAGFMKMKKGIYDDSLALEAKARWPLTEV